MLCHPFTALIQRDYIPKRGLPATHLLLWFAAHLLLWFQPMHALICRPLFFDSILLWFQPILPHIFAAHACFDLPPIMLWFQPIMLWFQPTFFDFSPLCFDFSPHIAIISRKGAFQRWMILYIPFLAGIRMFPFSCVCVAKAPCMRKRTHIMTRKTVVCVCVFYMTLPLFLHIHDAHLSALHYVTSTNTPVCSRLR